MSKLPLKINLNTKDKWKAIVSEAIKDEVPVEVMEKVTLNLIDGTNVDINIRQLLQAGGDPHDVHEELQSKLKELESYIEDVDFHINVGAVADTIQPATDKLLRRL